MTNKQTAQDKIESLVTRFEEQYQSYKHSDYNETLTRRDFIDPFFKALGWDIDNEAGYAEAYREVIHEDKVKVSEQLKHQIIPSDWSVVNDCFSSKQRNHAYQ